MTREQHSNLSINKMSDQIESSSSSSSEDSSQDEDAESVEETKHPEILKQSTQASWKEGSSETTTEHPTPPINQNEPSENQNDEWEDESDHPQGKTTLVVASHYNELKEAGRKERLKSRILHMRNFNNWVKSMLINEYLAIIKSSQRVGDAMRVLDLCCGKGGDLLKWEKANITHLICTDIAEVSIEQCKRRYDDMMQRTSRQPFGTKFSAEFFACDATLVRLRERYKDPSLKLNLVSCQFSFHYCFESLSQANCMVRNAAECLQPGGYFIATIPNANEIMRRLHASGNGRRFGNELYSIEFNCETKPPPLFGAKYHFHLEGVVDCPEFLVHFPTLIKLCRKHGLQLQRKTTFPDYFNECLPNGRHLLQRMGGLQTVFANRLEQGEEYAHVANFLKGSYNSRPIGTLSQSEWEAATLYLVCAFKKCKNTWNTKGEAVYEFE